MSEINLQSYMSDAIRRIMAKAYRNILSNPLQAKAVWRLQQTFQRSEKRRAIVKDKEGVEVPPFLICSIATTCNLHCKGCYARANGIAADGDRSGANGSQADGQETQKATLSPDQWKAIFEEAASLGINFALLAGGEPMMRRDILERVAEVEDMIFPIFTNGTLIGPSYIEFLKRHVNMIPVISIEGLERSTDERRGKGMYQRAMLSMEMLQDAKLFFGTSITVTTENFDLVTSDTFVDNLHERGCKIIFYVEYVPTEPGTEHLAFGDAEIARMEAVQLHQLECYKDMIILSFPGDEKFMGGCLAAGRGFFHIGPDGSAEPCPFSPFSDSSVIELGIKGALASPLFRKLREVHLVGGEHTGGCALFEHREEVEAMLQSVKS
ncbi:MAG: radical SAM protein [Bacteroidales bacterium]|nr:radical SAM protein [Bacteroidales bacterium]